MPTTDTTRRWVLGLACLAGFMVALDTLVVTTALTSIDADLHASIAQLEWTVNAYNLAVGVLLMTAAALGDRFGRRRLFAAGMVVFTLASAGSALAPSIGWLIAARTAQGAGAAFVLPLMVALVGAAYPPLRRGAAMGTLQGLSGLAVACGPMIGGAIAQGLTWRWIFWVNVPIGLCAVPLIWAKIPESRGGAGRLDPLGLGLITAAALGLVWGLVRGNAAGWGSAEVVASLVTGALALVAFVAWETRTRAPMLPLRLFSSRGFAAGNAASFLIIGSLYCALFFIAQFLQIGLGYDPLGAGLRMLPWTASVMFVAPLAGRYVDRVGARPFVICGLVMQVFGMTWIALVADPALAYWQLVAPLIIAGVGLSMAMPAAQIAVVGAVAPTDLGAAAGTGSATRQLGGVFGIAIGVAVFSGTGGYASAAAFSDGFVAAIGVSAALALAGLVAGFALPARARRAALGVRDPSVPRRGEPETLAR